MTAQIQALSYCKTGATSAPDDTAQTLWLRELAPMGLRLFRQYLTNGQTILPKVQDETLATFEPAFSVGKLGG